MGLRRPNALLEHPAAGGTAGPQTDNSGLLVLCSAGQGGSHPLKQDYVRLAGEGVCSDHR